MKGLDYSAHPFPSPGAIRAAGYGFVMRYASPDPANDASGKNLLKPELEALLAAGLKAGLVFEYAARQMLGGHAQGVKDAQHSDAVLKALGMAGLPVYFAADWDATPGQQAAINDYLDGAASVIGLARTGIYGGYYPVKRALDGGHARWAWQTYAWSGGQWDPRVNIRQHAGVTVGGADCDANESMTADFGCWPRPAAPVPPAVAWPAPERLSQTVQPVTVHFGWSPGDPRPPHWRIQLVKWAGQPGDVIASEPVAAPGFSAVVPGPGAYAWRVQAAGDSPFTAWRLFMA